MGASVERVLIDVTDATFQSEVIERSLQMPVVVDLWAPWCGPCKTLGPLLEKVVADANVGAESPRIALAKVNVDQNPAISQAFQVQSIPAVYVMRQGQIVDGFMGALPEAQVAEFISRFLPTDTQLEIESLIKIGTEESLLQALEITPGHMDAIVALATLYVDAERFEDALEMLAKVPENEQTAELAAKARVGLTFDSPENLEIETELADLLNRVKSDDEARARFVDLLALLGNDHPNTAAWRRKLSTAIY